MGRGSSGMGGGSLSKGSGANINIENTLDVWSYRHNPDNAPFADQINEGMRKIQRDFTGIMDSVQTVSAATLGGKDKRNTLGYYAPGLGGLAINDNYTNIDKMNTTYDAAVKSGFHPKRGRLSGTQAVTLHEAGHALTDYVAKKTGVDFDTAAANVVKAAYKKSSVKGGNINFAKTISGYATKNYAECVAEAVCDYYCNGSKAKKASKLIMDELRQYK